MNGRGVSLISFLDGGPNALGGDDCRAVVRKVVVNHPRSADVVLCIEQHRRRKGAYVGKPRGILGRRPGEVVSMTHAQKRKCVSDFGNGRDVSPSASGCRRCV